MIRPTEITADKTKNTLKITWYDNHESEYPFSLLRNACPCAECRGGHANMSSMPDPEVFSMPRIDGPASSLESINAVGTYAVCIRWQDGHDFGIFSWGYLRALCPCIECRGME